MKPFNLEDAIKGKPVVTRQGDKVTILYTKLKHSTYPIISVIEDQFGDEQIARHSIEGKVCAANSEGHCRDFFMAPEKKEKWLNIYNIPDVGYYSGKTLFDTKEEAEQEGREGKEWFVTTVNISWEE